MRDKAIIQFAIKEAEERAVRVRGDEVKYIMAKSVAEALKWALGEDNTFGVMVNQLKALDDAEKATIQ